MTRRAGSSAGSSAWRRTAHGYFLLLRHLIRRYGLPSAAYTDRHGIFHRDPRTPLTLAEQLQGRPETTQVGRALHELSIRWIPARSPQAKGRIERLFGTFQDRLRSELRLAGVRDRAGANAFLAEFLPRFNARFAQRPVKTASAYRPWPAALDPHTIFCFKYERIVSNDNTVTLGPHCLQIPEGPGGRSYAKATVEVHERLDGPVTVFYQQRCLTSQTVTETPIRVPAREHRRPRVASSSGGAPASRGSMPDPRRASHNASWGN